MSLFWQQVPEAVRAHPHDEISEFGSFSPGAQQAIAVIREENREWFRLAEDTHTTLMQIVRIASASESARGSNWSKEAVAVRLLLRTCGYLHGVVLLAEHGMVVQARTLTRSIIEDSFVAGALITSPDKMVAMLREDSEASRRNQARFIIARRLGTSDDDLRRLQTVADEIGRKADLLSPKKIAQLSSMLMQYINYLRLSDDSVHTTASSLDKHLLANADRTGWTYKFVSAERGDVTSTLHRTVLAALPVGIVINQLVPDIRNDAELADLGDRFQALPTGTLI